VLGVGADALDAEKLRELLRPAGVQVCHEPRV
jgi:hypothetical protein